MKKLTQKHKLKQKYQKLKNSNLKTHKTSLAKFRVLIRFDADYGCVLERKMGEI
jgi:hypothetical protein